MGSKWALQRDVTMDQTALQAQHAGDCVWLWCTASPSLFCPRLTLLLCFAPTEWANAASEKLNHKPECKWRGVLLVFSRLQGFLFCDGTPLCPYKQSVAIWGGLVSFSTKCDLFPPSPLPGLSQEPAKVECCGSHLGLRSQTSVHINWISV